jgi:hypothetical protein
MDIIILFHGLGLLLFWSGMSSLVDYLLFGEYSCLTGLLLFLEGALVEAHACYFGRWLQPLCTTP